MYLLLKIFWATTQKILSNSTTPAETRQLHRMYLYYIPEVTSSHFPNIRCTSLTLHKFKQICHDITLTCLETLHPARLLLLHL
jgi:hypothetical protein